MKVRENFGVVFFIFLLLSVSVFFLSKAGFLDKPASLLSSFVSTISTPAYNLLSEITSFGGNSKVKKLEDQNQMLSKKIVDSQRLLAENKSLHDQFQTASPKSLDLLAANVVGAPRFLPGISSPETYIIDVGIKDGVRMGSAVVFKDNLIGLITKTTDFLSEVTLISNSSSKFAAQTSTGVLGVVKGEGNADMVLDNVLLSETIGKDDFVVTGGDLNTDAIGVPPGLIVGRITSVDKNPSELFQKGKVESLVNFSKISDVFVVIGIR